MSVNDRLTFALFAGVLDEHAASSSGHEHVDATAHGAARIIRADL